MAPHERRAEIAQHHLGQVEAVGGQGLGPLGLAQLPPTRRQPGLEVLAQLVQLSADALAGVGVERPHPAPGGDQVRALAEDGRLDLVEGGRRGGRGDRRGGLGRQRREVGPRLRRRLRFPRSCARHLGILRGPRHRPRWPAPHRRCRTASKQSTAQAMPTLSDSARPVIGIARVASRVASRLASSPAFSLPNTNAEGPRQVAREVVRPRGGRPEDPHPGRPQPGEGPGRLGHHGEVDVEDRAGGGSDGLRVEGVDAARTEQHRLHPGGVAGPQHRSGIARVARRRRRPRRGSVSRGPRGPRRSWRTPRRGDGG